MSNIAQAMSNAAKAPSKVAHPLRNGEHALPNVAHHLLNDEHAPSNDNFLAGASEIKTMGIGLLLPLFFPD